MFGRLDLSREASVIVPEPLAYAPVRKVPFVGMPPPPPPSPLSVYVLANGGFGSRSNTPTSFGYNRGCRRRHAWRRVPDQSKGPHRRSIQLRQSERPSSTATAPPKLTLIRSAST